MANKTFSETVAKAYATLKPHDQQLWNDIITGLVKQDWKRFGGNNNSFFLLNKGSAQIKMFRNATSPQVIKICFSAPPEDEGGLNGN